MIGKQNLQAFTDEEVALAEEIHDQIVDIIAERFMEDLDYETVAKDALEAYTDAEKGIFWNYHDLTQREKTKLALTDDDVPTFKLGCCSLL